MQRRPSLVALSTTVFALAITGGVVARSIPTVDQRPTADPKPEAEWIEPDSAQTRLPDGHEITVDIGDHWDKIHAMEDADRPPYGWWYHYRYNDRGELARSQICHYVPATPEYAAAAAEQLKKAGHQERTTNEVEECATLESFNQ